MSENPFKSPSAATIPTNTSKRRPWLRYALRLLAIGALVTFLGLFYGVLTVGIPSPDAAPEVQQRERFHFGISKFLMILGICLLVFGLIGSVATILFRAVSRIWSGARSRQT